MQQSDRACGNIPAGPDPYHNLSVLRSSDSRWTRYAVLCFFLWGCEIRTILRHQVIRQFVVSHHHEASPRGRRDSRRHVRILDGDAIAGNDEAGQGSERIVRACHEFSFPFWPAGDALLNSFAWEREIASGGLCWREQMPWPGTFSNGHGRDRRQGSGARSIFQVREATPGIQV